MLRFKEKIKSIASFAAAIFALILLSLMFFPWFQWEEQESINGTIERLVIHSTSYGAKPNYIVTLDDGESIRVKAPPLSNYKSGDEIVLRLFVDQRNENLRRYAVKVPDRQ